MGCNHQPQDSVKAASIRQVQATLSDHLAGEERGWGKGGGQDGP